jgi:hypothetical protein
MLRNRYRSDVSVCHPAADDILSSLVFPAISLQAFPTISLGSQHWELKAANSSFTAALTVLNGCLEFSTMPQSMSHIANRSSASMMQGSLQSDDLPDDLECSAFKL